MADLAIRVSLDAESSATLARHLATELARVLPAARAATNDSATTYDLKGAAAKIGCSLSQLRSLISLGRVRTVRLTGRGKGRRVRIEHAEIERVIAEARR